MRKYIILALLTLIVININAQTVDEKIEKLLEIDGTINTIENLITETIENQKRHNFGISDNYWESLKNEVSNKSLNELKEIVIPIYSQIYTESEIDDLITFFSSKTGRLVTENQPVILEKLSLGLMQWSQNLNSYVIEEIENRDNNETTSDELEKFKTEFKSKYGLQILNLNELKIDKKNNIGDLLVDFGESDGKEDITKIIRIKNNTNKEITFDKPTFLIDDDIRFDWGEKPIKVGEIRDLKIILNSEKAEGGKYSFISLNPSEGNNIPIGVKYDVPHKELSFEVSKNELSFVELKQDLSDPYVFVIKNTGEKEFYISNIEIDKKIAYLNYSKEVIASNQEIEIRVIISKELIEKYKVKDLKLNLKVDLIKGERDRFSSFPNETIELKIE